MFFSAADLRELEKLLTFEPVVLPPQSVSVHHGYLQHAGAKYLGQVNLQYHLYLAPEKLVVPDAFSFGYQSSLKIAEDVHRDITTARKERVSISTVLPGESLVYTFLLEAYVFKRVYDEVIR